MNTLDDLEKQLQTLTRADACHAHDCGGGVFGWIVLFTDP
jgi:hypothetical protein